MAYPETDDEKDKQSFGGRGGGGMPHQRSRNTTGNK